MPEKSHNDHRPSSLQPSPFNSGLKMKMLTLVAMLIMVIYSMNEAGKPENWAWMGFEKPAVTNENRNPHDRTTPISKNSSSGVAADTLSDATNELASTPLTTRSSPPIRLADESLPPTTSNSHTGLPAESGKFWTSFFESLTTTQQVEWMELLEALRGSQVLLRQPVSQTHEELITRARKQRDAFNNRILDRMSSIPHASEKRSQVSQDYFEANEFWQKKISPALSALRTGEDITLTQQRAALDLQHHLDNDALNLVQDKTAIGWTGDSVAWKRCWNRIHLSEIGDPTFVKRIQLIGQPREFRGRAVTINGFVRDIEARRAKPNSSIAGTHSDVGETTYYILWVQPSESDAGPYCVYCLHPPAELPRTRSELADYQWMATINGVFFKNRSYRASDKSVQYSPLILADSFGLKPPVSEHPVLKWKLSPKLMAGFLALVPLLAVGIVWYAVRKTVSRKRLPSKKSQEELNVFLGDLKNDPSIKTDLEQIQAISEHSDDIS